MLFQLGLILAVFALPSLALAVFHLIYEGAILSALAEDSIAQWSELLAYRRFAMFAVVPAFALFSVGVAGASHVLRLFLFNQGFQLKDDFLIGIKRNWKNDILFALGGSFIIAILNFLITIVADPEAAALYFGLAISLFGISILVYCSFIYACFLNEVYEERFVRYLAVSIAFFFKAPHYALLVYFLVPGLFALLVLLNGLFTYVVILVSALILFFAFIFGGLSFGLLISFLLFASLADRFINAKQFPNLYRKGLFKEHE